MRFALFILMLAAVALVIMVPIVGVATWVWGTSALLPAYLASIVVGGFFGLVAGMSNWGEKLLDWFAE